MTTTLKLQAKSVYGEIKLYPICETSKLLAQLNGTKTLTDYALHIINKLGYNIEVAPPVSTYTFTLATDY